VIEVNDNPNIDAGVEDKLLGNDLYRLILQRFIEMIEE
jgi:glutathione synthase/RimK-type ligase-like ATP-grasp enzyme